MPSSDADFSAIPEIEDMKEAVDSAGEQGWSSGGDIFVGTTEIFRLFFRLSVASIIDKKRKRK